MDHLSPWRRADGSQSRVVRPAVGLLGGGFERRGSPAAGHDAQAGGALPAPGHEAGHLVQGQPRHRLPVHLQDLVANAQEPGVEGVAAAPAPTTTAAPHLLDVHSFREGRGRGRG